MGAESIIMKETISEISELFPFQLAFHTKRQSKDYCLKFFGKPSRVCEEL